MATLVLTAVGTMVGGPVGGAVGAILGQTADSFLFAPKARRGPRLGELAVQTSSYGTPLPRIFGRMRVAGTVIWSTDLVEQETSGGGGKGGPRTTSYSYSASFAVALSARRIRGIGRIWADGKLLRGAEGDLKAETGFRFYAGDEEQEIDPLIASVEGLNGSPAFRGIAYALFEGFQLADYGNRIPSLSFEVEADEAPVAIGEIAAELSAGELAAGETASLIGYAAGGDSVRGAIEALAEATPLSLPDDGRQLTIGAPGGPEVEVSLTEIVGGDPRPRFERIAGVALPAEVSISYHDPGRDWQVGLQRARLGGVGKRAERIALPVAIDSETAKGMAEARLAALWVGRVSGSVELGWSRAAARPGQLVRIEGAAGLWKVERWTLEEMRVRLELVRLRGGALPSGSGADPGRPTSEPDRRHGPTVLHLLDLPLAEESGQGSTRLLAAAAGEEPGWRRAMLSASFDGGGSWRTVGPTAAPAVMGRALDALPGAGSALLDRGEELIQFGVADALGQRRFRLSRLLRGRRGTEFAVSSHGTGERFMLIEPGTLASIDAPVTAIGGEARVVAQGVGDADGVEAAAVISGEALRPPSPVHLSSRRLPGGDLLIGWVRRSRIGWGWQDGADAPLGEEQERYLLQLEGAGFARSVECFAPGYLYSTGQQADDGAGTVTLTITQIGTVAASRPASLTVEL